MSLIPAALCLTESHIEHYQKGSLSASLTVLSDLQYIPSYSQESD